jgi:pyruvate,water dikinase
MKWRRSSQVGLESGQAPSDYPDCARFLVRCGIDCISRTPDTMLKTTQAMVEREQQQAGQGGQERGTAA